MTEELCMAAVQSRLFACEQVLALRAWFGRADKELMRILEQEFRRFLLLRVLHPSLRLIASGPVDMYWHRVILNWKIYEELKAHLAASFGYQLTHEPIDTNRYDYQLQCYAQTRELYVQLFGGPPELAGPDGSSVQVWCWPELHAGVSSSG